MGETGPTLTARHLRAAACLLRRSAAMMGFALCTSFELAGALRIPPPLPRTVQFSPSPKGNGMYEMRQAKFFEDGQVSGHAGSRGEAARGEAFWCRGRGGGTHSPGGDAACLLGANNLSFVYFIVSDPKG